MKEEFPVTKFCPKIVARTDLNEDPFAKVTEYCDFSRAIWQEIRCLR